MATQPISQGPFIRGVVASNQPLAQPKGAIARGSNLLLTSRGALTPCDGSGIINWFGGAVSSGRGRFESLFLFEPVGVIPYYMCVAKALDQRIATPANLVVSDGGGGGTLAAGTYYYKVTALDGVGGETVASNEASITIAADHVPNLTWNIVPNAFGYNVYRSQSSGSESLLIGAGLPVLQVAPGTTRISFSDTGAASFAGNIAISLITAFGGGSPQAQVTLATASTSSFTPGQAISISGNSNTLFNTPATVVSILDPFNMIVQAPAFTQAGGSGGTTSQGPLSPSSLADGGGGGGVWSTESGVAEVETLASESSNLLLCEGLGFNLPSNANVTQLSASVQTQATFLGFIFDKQVTFLKAGAPAGSDLSNNVAWLSNTRTYVLSNPGSTWNAADINSGGFGFGVAIRNTYSGQQFVTEASDITLTVTYTVPGGALTGTGGTLGGSVVPPVLNSAQQTVLLRMPGGNAPVSYSSSNIVAYFPASLAALGVPPTGGTGGGGTSGAGIGGVGSSTPNGGIAGLTGPLPQMKQFTNRLIIALGNGFPPQIYSDATGTAVNPAPGQPINTVSADGNGVVTVTTVGAHGIGTSQVGANVVLAGITNALYNGAFVTIAIPSTTTLQVVNPAAIGQAPASGGTEVLSTSPIISTFTPAYPLWVTASTFSQGDIIVPVTQPSAAIYLTCVQGGESGASEPSWPTGGAASIGNQVVDGKVIWQVSGLLNSAAPPPPGASHIEVYGNTLWVFNTAPANTANGLDGPCSLRASSVNNPNSWNPVNQAFLDKDDGSEGMGLAKFTITAAGIPPEGSMVAFKYRVPYQIVGVFGANNFSIQPASSDMGCLAPRSIQFVPGYGIMRYCHLGIAVFNGVSDQIVSEQVRPYLFPLNDAAYADITVADANYIPVSWAAQTANPPMYVFAAPIGNSGGQLTRLFCYDLVLKGWVIADLPFAVGCVAQVQPVTSNPITLLGGFSDGALQRWQAGDLQWYTGSGTSQAKVAWSFRTLTIASQNAAQRIYARRMVLRALAGDTSASAITVAPSQSGVALTAFTRTVPATGDVDLFVDVGSTGLRFDATVSSSLRAEIDGITWEIEPRPIGVSVGAV